MDVCFYHGGCVDGSLSAVTAKLAYPDIRLVPLYNREELPDPALWYGQDVVMIDFSLSRSNIEAMHRDARSFVLIDHHDTALRSLGDLSYCILDMTRSGAQMAWDFFFPGCQQPLLLRSAGEADRGLHLMPETIPLMDYGYNLSFAPEEWLQYMQDVECRPEYYIQAGEAVSIWKGNVVTNLANQKAFLTSLGGHDVWAINSSLFKNELSAVLNKHGKFAIVFSGNDGRWYWSLRSAGSINVVAIAEKNGGGGHKGAAAFSAEYAPMRKSSLLFPGNSK
jgi:hypothetical protein